MNFTPLPAWPPWENPPAGTCHPTAWLPCPGPQTTPVMSRMGGLLERKALPQGIRDSFLEEEAFKQRQKSRLGTQGSGEAGRRTGSNQRAREGDWRG